MLRNHNLLVTSALALGSFVFAVPAMAQDAEAETCEQQGGGAARDYQSVEQLPDGRVTFHLCAPEADGVNVTASDFFAAEPDGTTSIAMTRDARGLWSATTAQPVRPDTYRYDFEIDGVTVADPLATEFTRFNTGISTVTELAGPEGAFQTYDPAIAHGTVTQFDYWSDQFGAKREAYVYTPPGYMTGTDAYPVLYLVHGGGGNAEMWTKLGHAHYIIDNLIASGEIEPMIVVMPNGHTPTPGGGPGVANTAFGTDLHEDLIPFVDANFRTIADVERRAMAGLSMGGGHTMNFGLPRPDVFRYIGLFSIGLGMREDDVANYLARSGDSLPATAEQMELVYLAMGTDDFLYRTVEPTRAMLIENGIEHVYHETDGGHTWANWRRYLRDFLPRISW